MRNTIPYIILSSILLVSLGNDASGASILNSKHNLSISGLGQVKATTETRVCIFCHTTHRGRRDIPYLWNRQDQTVNYLPYQSTTIFAIVGQPTGASKLCLSCHDGTIALGALLSESEEVRYHFYTIPILLRETVSLPSPHCYRRKSGWTAMDSYNVPPAMTRMMINLTSFW